MYGTTLPTSKVHGEGKKSEAVKTPATLVVKIINQKPKCVGLKVLLKYYKCCWKFDTYIHNFHEPVFGWYMAYCS